MSDNEADDEADDIDLEALTEDDLGSMDDEQLRQLKTKLIEMKNSEAETKARLAEQERRRAEIEQNEKKAEEIRYIVRDHMLKRSEDPKDRKIYKEMEDQIQKHLEAYRFHPRKFSGNYRIKFNGNWIAIKCHDGYLLDAWPIHKNPELFRRLESAGERDNDRGSYRPGYIYDDISNRKFKNRIKHIIETKLLQFFKRESRDSGYVKLYIEQGKIPIEHKVLNKWDIYSIDALDDLTKDDLFQIAIKSDIDVGIRDKKDELIKKIAVGIKDFI